jgi:hypothetical protein
MRAVLQRFAETFFQGSYGHNNPRSGFGFAVFWVLYPAIGYEDHLFAGFA